MIFICKYIINKFAYVFSFVVFLCIFAGSCHGLDRDKVYHELLTVVGSINGNRSINTIVLHGSVAWKYIEADANNRKLVLQDIKINDLDFFVSDECFEEVISIIRNSLKQLSFEIRTSIRDNITWCCCYFRTASDKAVRVADFVKLEDGFPVQDVLFVKEEGFNLSIAKANWILAYEQLWLNNLNPKLLKYIDIIREHGNNWLALSINSDDVYAIYKSFNKFHEHLAMFDQINASNKVSFTLSLETQVISSKNILDNIIRDINIFLANNFGIDNAEQKKHGEKVVTQDCSQNKKNRTYADVVSKAVSNNGYNKLKGTKRKINSKGGKHQRSRAPSDIAMLSTDLARKMSFNSKKRYVLEKELTPNRQENNIPGQDTYNQKEHVFNCVDGLDGVDDELTVINAFDCLSISEEESSCSDSDDANPFTPSFSKKEFYKRDSADVVNKSTFLEQCFMSEYSQIRNLSLLFIMTLYFGYAVQADAIIATAGMLIIDASELMLAMLNFTINAESNWMITFPAVFALVNFKYKNKKRKKARKEALGLLISVYSSIYMYKFITGFNNKIELCPLPNWISEIKHITKYTSADLVTRNKSNTSSGLFTPDYLITPDKLTCSNLVALDKILKLAKLNGSILRQLEFCGLIDNTAASLVCYTNNWGRYHFDMELVNSQSYRCHGRDLCVSSKPVVGVLGEYQIGGYEPCCIENNGACSLPDGYFDEMMETDSFTFELMELKKTTYELLRYIPLEDGVGSYWREVVKNFTVGGLIVMDNIPVTGIYVFKHVRTGRINFMMCMVNKKFSMTPVVNLMDHD
ncbi:MAG: hypothetical protein QS748_12945 [Candidatus Endonucleobacter bathymodioli]|uniref:Uncharacterized protein n=1 Tax=Candidatus Endonucleibacter bathymodioli TaxID=539814 RepID=A0AA90NNF5_9GAMM|nr:hypothetical protein [Candidatus Endonucleobacter bathymodioli]